MKKRIRTNENGQRLFYPEDICIYCGRRLGSNYYRFTFRGEEPYHCIGWGPTCRDVYEQLQAKKKLDNLKNRILDNMKRGKGIKNDKERR